MTHHSMHAKSRADMAWLCLQPSASARASRRRSMAIETSRRPLRWRCSAARRSTPPARTACVATSMCCCWGTPALPSPSSSSMWRRLRSAPSTLPVLAPFPPLFFYTLPCSTQVIRIGSAMPCRNEKHGDDIAQVHCTCRHLLVSRRRMGARSGNN